VTSVTRAPAPLERVLVVGAGIAGLTVGNALTAAGVDCLVLEARDRIGGRLHTVDLAGAPVDLCGSWIHHPLGNPVREYAARAGIDCRPGNPLDALTGLDVAARRRLTTAELATLLRMRNEMFPAALAALQAELAGDQPATEAIERVVTAAELTPDVARQARQVLRGEVEAAASAAAADQSLRWLFAEAEYGGDYFGDLPDGGYRTVVDALGAGVEVRLGAPVDALARSASGVEVRCADGTVEAGSHAVVTLPLGVLKSRAVRFTPPLPADRQEAIDRLGFGSYEKVALRFAEPFWRAADLAHLLVLPADADAPALWVIDRSAFDGPPVLTAHVLHSCTGNVLGHSAEHAARWVLDMIAAATGLLAPAPLAVATTSWGDDPYSLGGYSHVPPGADPALLDLIGEPVDERLLFAGEHAQSARMGYADGAMSSGLRAARRLLNTGDVTLGVPRP
jgi:polyamine oxidase